MVFIQARGVSSSERVARSACPRSQGGTATGSGFVVDKDGTIITNAHVVEGSDDVQVRFGEEGDFVDAEVAGRDPSTDLAVLKVDPDDAEARAAAAGRLVEGQGGRRRRSRSATRSASRAPSPPASSRRSSARSRRPTASRSAT